MQRRRGLYGRQQLLRAAASGTERPAALLFDVFGTLVDWRSAMIARVEAAAAAAPVAIDAAGLVDAWRGAYAPAMDAVRRGERAWANIDVLHGEALDALLPHFGAEALAARRDHLVRGWHSLEPWPDVPDGLVRLGALAVTASLSNGHLGLLIPLARHARLRFDTLFSAETFRHYKPDAETYLGAAGLLGLEPTDVMLCASHPSDLRAAAASGLRTAHVRRPREFGSPATEPPPGDAPFEHVVEGLGELAEALRHAPRSRRSPLAEEIF